MEPSKKETHHLFPKSIFFILGNEFCERFCFYGMRTILTIYLTERLLFSEDTATMLFHVFAMLSYFTPILGAIVADTWLGRFRTIFYVSFIYVLGVIMISVGSFPNSLQIMKVVSLLGLVIIGIGTGGIKPCVSAFGGDQFHSDQVKEREHFFSIFYFSINLGSLLSTLLTPILRADVSCFNENTCYPLAFGVPAILMIIAVVFFVLGKSRYIIKEPEGNVLPSVLGCIFRGILNKWESTDKEKKAHWLDYAEDKYEKSLISDIKILLHILVLFIPLPIFWALFDQTGSRWTLQATKMNGELYGINIKPDQLQASNPVFIIIFIPLFQYAVYPLLGKCNILTKPLQRITLGGFLAALAFVMAGFLEIGVEGTLPVLPEPGYSQLIVVNLNPCSVNITGPQNYLLKANEMTTFSNLKLKHKDHWTFSTVADQTAGCANLSETVEIVNSNPIQSTFLAVESNKIHVQTGSDQKAKSRQGFAQVRVFFSIQNLSKNATFEFKGHRAYLFSHDNETGNNDIGRTGYIPMEPGKYEIYLTRNESSQTEISIGEAKFHSGGTYIVGIVKNTTYSNFLITTTVNPNSLHILLQIPQYFVLTAAEIMFSITGLEFSYSQAPLSMKSVIQAAWLMTVSLGNVVVAVVAEAEIFKKKYWEFFMFSILMAVDMLAFAILAYFYKYIKVKTQSQAKPLKKHKINDVAEAAESVKEPFKEGSVKEEPVEEESTKEEPVEEGSVKEEQLKKESLEEELKKLEAVIEKSLNEESVKKPKKEEK
nr:solute carrier family 15 member 1-like [Parasteatoda tepidariorum]